MSRPFYAERTAIFRNLVNRHFAMLALRYGISEDDSHWQQLLAQVTTLHQIAGHVCEWPVSNYQDTIKLLITDHWRLCLTQSSAEVEPPEYLIAAVDVIEKTQATWFSYAQERWVEE